MSDNPPGRTARMMNAHHEQDYHNFSTSSSHKLPTISGSQAIRNARQNAHPIPTSLGKLDATLAKATTVPRSLNSGGGGGISRGVVTEIFGPPGVGKTTFALQVAINALQMSGTVAASVTWIDTSSRLVRSRFDQLAAMYRAPSADDLPSSPPVVPQPGGEDTRASPPAARLQHLQVTMLPKLLTLFLHPNANFPPPNTNLIVLDDISNLILSSLPRFSQSSSSKGSQKGPSTVQDATLAKRALSRRFQVLSSFASSLQRFAAANNVAILVTSKATMNLRVGQRAVLRPALASQQWDNYLSTRIALFRDLWPGDRATAQHSQIPMVNDATESEKKSLRYAKVVRLGGKSVSSPAVDFVIEEGGLCEAALRFETAEISVLPLATQPLRPLEDVLDSGANRTDEIIGVTAGLDHPATVSAEENSLPIVVGNSKRKAIEIADSDEEAGDDTDSDDSVSLPPAVSTTNEFRPSSQVLHEYQPTKDPTDDKAPSVHAKRSYANAVASEVEADEMLLETHEKQFPLFSQAAAEMSEPLTPSDDDRDIS